MSETEIKGVDGRYRARRPPVDEVRLAPGRRATLAGLGSAPLTFGELVAGPEVREERERERAKAEAGEEEEKATGEVKAPSER